MRALILGQSKIAAAKKCGNDNLREEREELKVNISKLPHPHPSVMALENCIRNDFERR
jgi:hypothetical protein